MPTADDDTTREVRLLREACRRLGLVDDAGDTVTFKLAVRVYGSPTAAHHKAGNLYAALKGRRQLPRQVLVAVLGLLLDEDTPKGDIANDTSILLHYPADVEARGIDMSDGAALCGWQGSQHWCTECAGLYQELYQERRQQEAQR